MKGSKVKPIAMRVQNLSELIDLTSGFDCDGYHHPERNVCFAKSVKDAVVEILEI